MLKELPLKEFFKWYLFHYEQKFGVDDQSPHSVDDEIAVLKGMFG